MSNRRFVDVLKEIQAIVPPSETELTKELKQLEDDIFLILPETEHRYWWRLGFRLARYMSDNELIKPGWKHDIYNCFIGKKPR